MSERAYFGTDGIRGKVGVSPITPQFMLRLGWAIGKALDLNLSQNVLIGKDTRISGYMLEYALTSGLTAAGTNVVLTGPLPTPAISYLTQSNPNISVGIVISASHNPHHDNGLKIFNHDGNKLPDQLEQKIESFLSQDLEICDSKDLGKVSRDNTAPLQYINHCVRSFKNYVSTNQLHMILDCANGATYQVAPKIFADLNQQVQTLAANPNGWNINAECGSTSTNKLIKAVQKSKADLGIALDGDGDRVIMVDHTGEVLDGDELIFIISKYRKALGMEVKGVIGTLMSNLGLEIALKNNGIEFQRVKVGDKYVSEALTKTGWRIGGESSGHIICTDFATTGDGLISALLVLTAINHFKQPLHNLKKGMQKYPQQMINVPVISEHKYTFSSHSAVVAAVKTAEETLGDAGRVLLRPSGTEPLVRVMVEGSDTNMVKKIVNSLAQVVRQVSSSETL